MIGVVGARGILKAKIAIILQPAMYILMLTCVS